MEKMRPRVVNLFTFRKAGPPNTCMTRSRICWALGLTREGGGVEVESAGFEGAAAGFCPARSHIPSGAISRKIIAVVRVMIDRLVMTTPCPRAEAALEHLSS